MEKVYPRVADDRHPEVYLREVGAGRVVYFPWDIDRIFWEVLAVDHGMLLRNAVDVGDQRRSRRSRSTGPGVLDVTVWRQKDSMTVHLVNLTNPMMMKGPFRELIPVGPQTVRVNLGRRNVRACGCWWREWTSTCCPWASGSSSPCCWSITR